MPVQDMPPSAIRRTLGLQTQTLGGAALETWRHGENGQACGGYWLLEVGELLPWHRLPGLAIWHWYAGAPLSLSVSATGHDAHACRLGPDLPGGQIAQAAIPQGHYQTAESLGGWTLLSYTVMPALSYADRAETAPPHWRPEI